MYRSQVADDRARIWRGVPCNQYVVSSALILTIAVTVSGARARDPIISVGTGRYRSCVLRFPETQEIRNCTLRRERLFILGSSYHGQTEPERIRKKKSRERPDCGGRRAAALFRLGKNAQHRRGDPYRKSCEAGHCQPDLY